MMTTMKHFYLQRVIVLCLLTTLSNIMYGQITATMTSARDLVLDSNKPCEEGPSTAYVSFLIKNEGVGPVMDLTATLTINPVAGADFRFGGASGSEQVATQAVNLSGTLTKHCGGMCTPLV